MQSNMIIGYLVSDVTVRQTENSMVANGTIVVRGAGEGVDEETGKPRDGFFDFFAWGKSAEILEKYTTKGHQVSLQYELQDSRWTEGEGDSEQTRKKVRLRVTRVGLLNNKSGDVPEINVNEASSKAQAPLKSKSSSDEYNPFEDE